MISDTKEKTRAHTLRRFILIFCASTSSSAGWLVATTRAAVVVLRTAPLETVSVDILGPYVVSVSGS